MPCDPLDELTLSAASLSDRRAPRRSKRLSHTDSDLDSSMEHDERHSAKKRKDAAAAQSHNQLPPRRPLGDITNAQHSSSMLPGSSSNPRAKQLYSTTACPAASTAVPLAKAELYHGPLDAECDGDGDVSLADMVDAPGMDTTDDDDKDDDDERDDAEADSSELDGSLDEDELLFSANKQRALHQRDIDERKEGAILPQLPANYSTAVPRTALISLTPTLASEVQLLMPPAIAPAASLSTLLLPPPPSAFFAPPAADPLPFHSCMADYAPTLAVLPAELRCATSGQPALHDSGAARPVVRHAVDTGGLAAGSECGVWVAAAHTAVECVVHRPLPEPPSHRPHSTAAARRDGTAGGSQVLGDTTASHRRLPLHQRPHIHTRRGGGHGAGHAARAAVGDRRLHGTRLHSLPAVGAGASGAGRGAHGALAGRPCGCWSRTVWASDRRWWVAAAWWRLCGR